MSCGKRRFGRFLSLILAMAVLVNMTVPAAAEQTGQMGQSEQTGQTGQPEQTGQMGQTGQPEQTGKTGQTDQPEQTSQSEQTAKYRMGRLRVLFEDYQGLETLMVLCQEDTGTVWINAADFVGNLANYSFSFDAEEKTAEIQVWNRKIAFQAGSSETAYAIGENECFYRMSEPALYYKERFWIPADEFFYYLCCLVSPVSLSEDEEYDPTTDYLLVKNPNYTVLDVLYDIYARDNGADWMFAYEKDFGMTEENIEDLLEAARIAVPIYDTATGNWRNILGYCTLKLTDNYNEVINRINEDFGADLEEVISFYDVVNIENFLSAMLYISREEMEEVEEEFENEMTVYENGIEAFGSAVKDIVDSHVDTQSQALQKMLAPGYEGMWGVVQNSRESLLSSSDSWKDVLDTGTEYVGLAAKLMNLGFVAAGIIEKTKGQSETITQAMDYYMDASDSDTIMPSGLRDMLHTRFVQMKAQALYAAAEIVSAGIEEFLPDMILKIASASSVGTVTGLTNVAWYAIEKSDILPLAKVSEAVALQQAMFGMMYESDAWRELTSSYIEVALANGLSDYEQVKDCAWLAANYLKACLVTTEAGLESMASSEFAGSDAYAGAKTKKRQLAKMLSVITDAVTAEEYGWEDQYPRYGILCNRSVYGENEMTYEMFRKPSALEAGTQYHYQEPDLNAECQTILPLVRFPNYYEFIRDELLPERGYASTEDAYAQVGSDTVMEDRFWDLRSGLLGADIADLNGDGTDDLLVYYYGEYLTQWSNDLSPNCLIAELYTMDEDGEIYLIGDQCLDCNTDLCLDYIAGGLMTIDGKTLLYSEYVSQSYFANGDEVYYNFYEFTDEGTFLPRWSLGKTDGGSSSIAYSLLTRTEGETYEKLVLWADSEFGLWYPDTPVYTSEGVSEADAVRIGFSMLSLPADKAVMPYLDMPSYFGDATLVKPSFRYYCAGDGDYRLRNMQVTLTEYTELKEHIDALDKEG